MVKEQLQHWARYILLAVVITFASGGWVAKVMSNANAIADVKKESVAADKSILEKVEKTKDDVVDLKLRYKDIQGLTTSIYQALRDIKDSQRTSNIVQQTMVTNVAVISEKVQNLTKAE